MASTSETGHAKNVANFDRLISFCTGYGATYNPVKDSLTISKLNELADLAKTHLQDTKITKAEFDIRTNDRQNAFKELRPLSTKITNALSGVGASEAIIKDAQTINKKIQGARSTSNKPIPTDTQPTASEKTISTSQQSYDSLIDHFAKYIELLTQEPLYTPNEADLQIPNLQLRLTAMKNANTATIDTYTAWSNARITRNQTLYNPLTGIVRTASDVKKYVKSVYGATSPQYKQISDLQFKATKEL